MWRRLARRRVRRYLTDALTVIETRALYSATVDWPEVRAAALLACAGAVAYADTHETLAGVLRQAGGPHSGLRPPGASAWRAVDRPTGGLVDGVAHVRLPACGGANRRYRDTGHRLVRDLAAAGPAGWVVDLRGNLGGSMWPMLAVVAPLLPDGVLGHFVPPDGPDQTWELRRGRVLLGGRTLARTTGPVPPAPVAVLTDGRTASSGEAVAVAFRARPEVRTFGSATMGMTSANETHPLRGGTRLNVTVAYFADRHRTVHRGPLPPDEDGGTDPLAAAVAWVRRER
ncbi:S41 family peptidase [Dactylosporangium sp. NBC_01737]|uniref:S41 family peptidase n=1 Tax=Dactylosporangium sp. NBC_01737 TaxID=2975959 RepID=UPI002E0FE039|nr:S41 family peptidase [Dactylosporangium sp. NBC_01737]